MDGEGIQTLNLKGMQTEFQPHASHHDEVGPGPLRGTHVVRKSHITGFYEDARTRLVL